MIRYALKCDTDHAFESWFQSAEAFDKLLSAGMVNCPSCGTAKVTKSLMAPQVRAPRSAASGDTGRGDLTTPASPEEAKLAELRRKVEKNSEYVGMNFVAEARKMHDGDTPERSIYGEARPEEARQLIEDGVPVAPLPFMPNRKTN